MGNEPRPLAGKVAIVTGAGRGIGRAIAVALAQHGADVALAARSTAQIEEAAEWLRREHGVRALAQPTDITDAEAVERLAHATVDELGRVDILVNNSGAVRLGTFLEQSQEDFEAVLDTNLRGTALCLRAIGARLVAQGSGKVITIASYFGERAIVGGSAYCASKAALLNLTRVLALEWARHGVQVNAIAPGYVETEMNADLRADPERFARIVRRIPAGRFGRPEEIAALAAFLAGPSADFITGETIVVDGGELARV